MKKHLFVNGTSVASGWGKGQERVAQPGKKSWVHHFAEKMGADELWNVSVVSKPIGITIDHTIGFCEQYLERYKTYKNLFVAIELILPQHEKWDTVRHTLDDVNEVVTPIVVQLDTSDMPNADVADRYQTIFVRHKKHINYLEQDTLFHYIPPSEVMSIDYAEHLRKLQSIAPPQTNLTKRLVESAKELSFLQHWLAERNIAFMMHWAAGMHPGFQRRVDKAILKNTMPHRLVPMQHFTAFSKGAEWSIDAVANHPDSVGQFRIAEFLYEYACTHNLFENPKKTQEWNSNA